MVKVLRGGYLETIMKDTSEGGLMLCCYFFSEERIGDNMMKTRGSLRDRNVYEEI